jgi:hypothetical protein
MMLFRSFREIVRKATEQGENVLSSALVEDVGTARKTRRRFEIGELS